MVRGLTKDLPGALAATSSASSSDGQDGGGEAESTTACLIERTAPAELITSLRQLRDSIFLESAAGRHLTKLYYAWLGSGTH